MSEIRWNNTNLNNFIKGNYLRGKSNSAFNMSRFQNMRGEVDRNDIKEAFFHGFTEGATTGYKNGYMDGYRNMKEKMEVKLNEQKNDQEARISRLKRKHRSNFDTQYDLDEPIYRTKTYTHENSISNTAAGLLTGSAILLTIAALYDDSD